MNRVSSFLALGAILVSACGTPHGQPHGSAEVLAPNEVLEFAHSVLCQLRRVSRRERSWRRGNRSGRPSVHCPRG